MRSGRMEYRLFPPQPKAPLSGRPQDSIQGRPFTGAAGRQREGGMAVGRFMPMIYGRSFAGERPGGKPPPATAHARCRRGGLRAPVGGPETTTSRDVRHGTTPGNPSCRRALRSARPGPPQGPEGGVRQDAWPPVLKPVRGRLPMRGLRRKAQGSAWDPVASRASRCLT